MTGTLFGQDLLNTPLGFAVAGLIGILFGWFLEQAGFGSSRRLTGIFYFRDMAVLKVMFTAVVTALVGTTYLAAAGWLAPGQVYGLDTYWQAQIAGGLVFGAGFVIGGWCPGTALVGLGGARLDALVFLAGAVLGTVGFNELYAVVAPVYGGACAGVIFLEDSLRVSRPQLVLAVCVVAVALFAAGTWLEQRFGGLPRPDEAARRRHRWAALLLLALAGGTFFLPPAPAPGTPRAEGAPSVGALATGGLAADGSELLRAVAAGEDHIEPLDLAARLMAGEAGLVVADVRPAADYARFHLRGAISLPLDELAAQAAQRLPRTGRVVLTSNGTTHAAQAWMVLRAAGWTNATVLTDGLLAFWRECLTPPSLAGYLDGAAARAAGAAFAARRAFFLEGSAAPTAAAAAPAAPPEPALAEPGLGQHVVGTAWLQENLDNPVVRVVDVRAKSTAYTTAHIPGAVYLGVESVRGTVEGVPSMLLPESEIATLLGRLGLRSSDTIVLYSDALRDATLAAMALQRVGHRSFAVLHGGTQKWTAEGRPVDAALPAVRAVAYELVAGADTFTASTDDVKATLGDGKTVILDVGPADYFAGQKSDEARAGHIPGAVNREFKLDLAGDREVWKSADALRGIYAGMGIRADTPVVVHCRTGHQASQSWFLLRHVLGLKNVRWYDGSWSAWASRGDLPVER